MSKETIGRVIKLVGELGADHEVAHQDEQRNDRERIGEPGLVGDLADHRGRDVEVQLVGDTREPDDAHGEGHRYAQEGKDQEGGETDQRFGHVPAPSAMVRCGRCHMSRTSVTAVSAMRTLMA